MTGDACLIRPDLIVNLIRPPFDCSVCHDLVTIDRVSQLSREKFEQYYAYSGRPVVVTDAMTNWSAVGTFNFEFFRDIYSADSPVLLEGARHCQFFPYRTSFKNLSEVFHMGDDRVKMTDGAEPWYIGW